MTTTLPQLAREPFIDAILARYEVVTPGTVTRSYAEDVLDGFLILDGPPTAPGKPTIPLTFGHPDYDWSAEAAAELADEDMSLWGQDHG